MLALTAAGLAIGAAWPCWWDYPAFAPDRFLAGAGQATSEPSVLESVAAGLQAAIELNTARSDARSELPRWSWLGLAAAPFAALAA